VPELPEIEMYRRLAERVVGREVVAVGAPDPWYLKGGVDAVALSAALLGRRIAGIRRHGKLLLLDTAGPGPTLGLRFGMTGRLVVDGVPGVDVLLYSSSADLAAWDRFWVEFAPRRGRSGSLVVRDPRRLGGVELDPDESRLGPDAQTLRVGDLRAALGESAAPLKARIMDQAKVAGIGNLVADEVLWRAGLDPARPAGSLTDNEVRRLARVVRSTIAELITRGGSHTGDLMPARHPGGRCARDGAELVRRTIGGRTTWSCPVHQL
jgi:formamidopyrimidine-DNA glycosylase